MLDSSLGENAINFVLEHWDVITLMITAISCIVYAIFKGNKFFFLGGICETIGQAFYMAVMFAEFEVGMVIICAYCALSVLWGGIFLKEKLSWKHYAAIACAFAGIMLLG